MESCWNKDTRFRPDMYVLNGNLSEKLLEDSNVSDRNIICTFNCYARCYFAIDLKKFRRLLMVSKEGRPCMINYLYGSTLVYEMLESEESC